MPAAAASSVTGRKRGRKQDDTLPVSRSIKTQRAFRARRAALLSNLETRVTFLERENRELRRRLGLDEDGPPVSGDAPELIEVDGVVPGADVGHGKRARLADEEAEEEPSEWPGDASTSTHAALPHPSTSVAYPPVPPPSLALPPPPFHPPTQQPYQPYVPQISPSLPQYTAGASSQPSRSRPSSSGHGSFSTPPPLAEHYAPAPLSTAHTQPLAYDAVSSAHFVANGASAAASPHPALQHPTLPSFGAGNASLPIGYPSPPLPQYQPTTAPPVPSSASYPAASAPPVQLNVPAILGLAAEQASTAPDQATAAATALALLTQLVGSAAPGGAPTALEQLSQLQGYSSPDGTPLQPTLPLVQRRGSALSTHSLHSPQSSHGGSPAGSPHSASSLPAVSLAPSHSAPAPLPAPVYSAPPPPPPSRGSSSDIQAERQRAFLLRSCGCLPPPSPFSAPSPATSLYLDLGLAPPSSSSSAAAAEAAKFSAFCARLVDGALRAFRQGRLRGAKVLTLTSPRIEELLQEEGHLRDRPPKEEECCGGVIDCSDTSVFDETPSYPVPDAMGAGLHESLATGLAAEERGRRARVASAPSGGCGVSQVFEGALSGAGKNSAGGGCCKAPASSPARSGCGPSASSSGCRPTACAPVSACSTPAASQCSPAGTTPAPSASTPASSVAPEAGDDEEYLPVLSAFAFLSRYMTAPPPSSSSSRPSSSSAACAPAPATGTRQPYPAHIAEMLFDGYPRAAPDPAEPPSFALSASAVAGSGGKEGEGELKVRAWSVRMTRMGLEIRRLVIEEGVDEAEAKRRVLGDLFAHLETLSASRCTSRRTRCE
ncbi:hypothetical protein JCM10207_006802 [Rhodosporidiobolus poonsookiae]